MKFQAKFHLYRKYCQNTFEVIKMHYFGLLGIYACLICLITDPECIKKILKLLHLVLCCIFFPKPTAIRISDFMQSFRVVEFFGRRYNNILSLFCICFRHVQNFPEGFVSNSFVSCQKTGLYR